MDIVQLSPEMTRFFEVEIRNESQGGTSPSTLYSARSSLEQAPDDVVADWSRGDRDDLLMEINLLIACFEDFTHLSLLVG